MSILDRDAVTATGDEAAIASLRAAFAAQKKAFIADPYPSYEERMGHLGALAVMMMTYRTQISDALTADFGSHPAAASDLIEVLGVAGRAQYAMSQLQT